MTWDEFKGDWFPAHCAAFTGIRAWLAKISRGDGAPTEAQIVKGWYNVLREVDLEAANAATARMHAGDIEEPKGFDRHPAAIRRACGVQRQRRDTEPRFDADGNQMFSCRDCLDSGYVLCWHPTSMKAMRDGTFGNPYTVYSAYVVCHCPAGNQHDGRREFPRFDCKRHLPIQVATWHEDDRARLAEFVGNMRPAGYERAFDRCKGEEP